MKKINRQDGIAPLVIVLIVFAVVVVGGGALYMKRNKAVVVESPTPTQTATPTASSSPSLEVEVNVDIPAVKEFTTTSYYEMKDGKATANFSVSEIRVKKGDTVKINITNIRGTHDFNIDEYGIKKSTPLNQPVVIEFTADKVGNFKYYCSMPGHRQMGQEGTLIVEE